MTSEEIHTLDGPALCRLAWELGLAPPGIVTELPAGWCWSDGAFYRRTEAGYEEWQPHRDLAQADALFWLALERCLSNGGIEVQYRHGHAWIEQPGDQWRVDTAWGEALPPGMDFAGVPREDSKAHALLLCACLAGASEG